MVKRKMQCSGQPDRMGVNRALFFESRGFDADELQSRNMIFWEEFVQAVSTERSFS